MSGFGSSGATGRSLRPGALAAHRRVRRGDSLLLAHVLDSLEHELEQGLLVGQFDNDRCACPFGRQVVFERIEIGRKQAPAQLLRALPGDLDDALARIDPERSRFVALPVWLGLLAEPEPLADLRHEASHESNSTPLRPGASERSRVVGLALWPEPRPRARRPPTCFDARGASASPRPTRADLLRRRLGDKQFAALKGAAEDSAAWPPARSTFLLPRARAAPREALAFRNRAGG